eukprot:210245-Prymnesium_polylepis.2
MVHDHASLGCAGVVLCVCGSATAVGGAVGPRTRPRCTVLADLSRRPSAARAAIALCQETRAPGV